ncbi:MAG: copper resistance protein B [Okeania sp. SIO3B3]|nr:copper resistance protein B [Okeania sp. SIO3B3]
MRLRYEFSRPLAPYIDIGISWERKFAGTADFAREEGESVDKVKFVGGFRFMF